MSKRPGPLATLVTLAALGFWIWPPLWLHIRAIAELVRDPGLWQRVSPLSHTSLGLLQRSLELCAGVFVLSLLLGAPVGFAMARGPRWWRGLALPLCAVALAIPPALAAAPFVSLSTASGSPEDGSLATFLLSVMTLSGCYFPLVAGATLAAIAAIPSEEEDVALLFGSDFSAWRGALGARVLPASSGGAFIAAALALWEMGAPDLLGWPTFSMHVYRNLAATDASSDSLMRVPAALSAALIGLPVLVLGVVLLWPAVRLLRSLEGKPTRGTRDEPPRKSALALAVLPFASVILLIFPGSLIVHFAHSAGSAHQAQEAITANLDAVQNTVLLPGAAALILPAVGFVLAAIWREWPASWRRGALLLGLWPLLVTPVVLGVSLVEAWNRDAFAAIYDSTYAMTLIGYAARYGPLCLALTVWSVQSLDEDLLRSASGLGARWHQVVSGVILPLLRVPLCGLAALTFALCAGELTVTILVQAPGGSTLPLPIFSLLHAGLGSDVAALCLLQCVLSGGALLIGAVLFGRRT